MGPVGRRIFGLCLPPASLACLDAGLTLYGQSAAYWAGNYADVNELSPSFQHLMSYHPLAFVVGFALWILIFIGLILLLPQTFALTTSIAVALGHTLGASSWLIFRFHYGYQACNGLFALCAVMLAIGIRWGWRAEPRFDQPIGVKLPLLVRFGAVALLLGIAAYLFLWPRTP